MIYVQNDLSSTLSLLSNDSCLVVIKQHIIKQYKQLDLELIVCDNQIIVDYNIQRSFFMLDKESTTLLKSLNVHTLVEIKDFDDSNVYLITK